MSTTYDDWKLSYPDWYDHEDEDASDGPDSEWDERDYAADEADRWNDEH